MNEQWIAVKDKLPDEGVKVVTKIDDANGARNEQTLKRQGNLWFMPSDCDNPGHAMYVYYVPTHWRPVA